MKAALYVRVSTAEQAEEGFSIQAQENLLKEYCEKNKLEIFKIYADEGISGQKENRPQFQHMLKDAEKKLFNLILVHKYDRFARKVELSQRVKNQLSKSGINVISITEPIEDSPMGFFVSGLHELMAEYYVRNLAEEVRKGMRERVSQGLHNGSVPYGYRVNKETGIMEIYEEQAAVVRKIFEMYTEGHGSAQISKWLCENNISSAVPGAKWNHYAVLYILRNVKYIGLIKHAGEIYQGKHEPIIEKELFEIAQKNRKDNYLPREPVGKNEQKFMLLGLMRCGVCGYKIAVRSRLDERVKVPTWRNYYVCSRSKVHENHHKCTHNKFHKTDELEEFVLKQYIVWLKGLASEFTTKRNDNLLVESQIAVAQKVIDRAEAAYLGEAMSLERYVEIKKNKEKEIMDLKIQSAHEKPVSIIEPKTELDKLLNEPSPAKRRLLMQKYVKEIQLFPDGRINFVQW